MKITKPLIWVLVMALAVATSEAWAQHSEHGTPRGTPPEKLGEVNFPVSCNAAAQKDFNRAMALFSIPSGLNQRRNRLAAKMDYWAGQADFQIKTVSAWIALAEKHHEEAVRLMRAAADAEDASDKHPITPGNVAPSRELLGEMLMTLNSPAQAFVEFERSLGRDPNRFRGIYALLAPRKALAIGARLAIITPGC